MPTTAAPTLPATRPARRGATRLGRIVVHRLGMPGVAAEAAPGRCAEDRRELEAARPADLVWRLPGAAPVAAAGC